MGVAALVPAAGRGERLGARLPKALLPVRGVPLLTRAVRGLLDSAQVDTVVVAAPEGHVHEVTELVAGGRVQVLAGGADRTTSVRRALDAADEPEFVLVHDAARAFTPATVIADVVAALREGASAVVPVLPVADTVKRVDADVVTATVDRSALRAVQTPQGFTAGTLRAAYRNHDAGPRSDDAGLAEAVGAEVRTVPGHPHAMKITTPFDLAVAEAVLASAELV